MTRLTKKQRSRLQEDYVNNHPFEALEAWQEAQRTALKVGDRVRHKRSPFPGSSRPEYTIVEIFPTGNALVQSRPGDPSSERLFAPLANLVKTGEEKPK